MLWNDKELVENGARQVWQAAETQEIDGPNPGIKIRRAIAVDQPITFGPNLVQTFVMHRTSIPHSPAE
jgi:hypothetical protein